MIKRFEELAVWQNARELCIKIRSVVEQTSLEKDFSLKDQILRSSGSVMDNIAEGFERDGNKEFIHFLYIAKGSLGETRSQVHRSFDANHITKETYDELMNGCLNLSSKISRFISYLNNSKYQGLMKKLKP